MKRKSYFRFLSTVVLSLYTTATIQAGQVITSEERGWARDALKREATLGSLDSSQSVAVLNYHNLSGQEQLNPLQKGFALMLITDLSKVENIVVVERIRMQALVDEMELGGSGLVDVATAPRVGKYLKAAYVNSGDIRQDSAQALELAPYLINVPFEVLTDMQSVDGNLEELYRMEKTVLFDIIRELDIDLSSEKKRELAAPLSLSSTALFALFMGIDFSDRGMYEEAGQMYEKALAEDPNLQIAEDSLKELTDMGLKSSEDISVPEAEETVAAEGGSGAGTVLAVGIGLAAAAAGIGLALSSSSSDDDNGGNSDVQSSNQQTNTSGTPEAPTATVNDDTYMTATSVECYGDELIFSFSQPMNPSAGSVSPSPSFDGQIIQKWIDSQNYFYTWDTNYMTCSSYPETFTFTLQNFVSESGVPLGGTTTFSLSVDNY